MLKRVTGLLLNKMTETALGKGFPRPYCFTSFGTCPAGTEDQLVPSSGPQVGVCFQSEVRGLLLHVGVFCPARDGRKSGSGPALWAGLWIRR